MIIPSIILIFNFLCFTFGKHHSYLHRNLHYKKNGIHYGNLRFGINLEQKTFIKDNQPFRFYFYLRKLFIFHTHCQFCFYLQILCLCVV